MYNTSISDIIKRQILSASQWSSTYSNRDLPFIGNINSGGVYVYLDTSLNKIIYVGKTEDLDRRLQEHWSDNEPNIKLKQYLHDYPTKVLYKKEDSDTRCSGMELYLYNYYKPVCNDRVPTASQEIAVSLPIR